MQKIIFTIILPCLSLFQMNLASSKDYVTVEFLGQLGNQMFQIATAYSLALDNNAVATFPDIVNLEKHEKRRQAEVEKNYHHVLFRLNVETPDAPFTHLYEEPKTGYCPIPYSPNLLLRGYFQSYKYFDHHRDKICELFAPSSDILNYLQAHYENILAHPKTVSIHIRNYKMEDYTGFFLPTVSWGYVQKAMSRFDQDSLFVVFSNSMNWVKNYFQRSELTKKYHIVFIENEPNYIDLYLMSLCKNNIIANSTFSWWAAYLNQNKDKKIIVPAQWLGVKNAKNLPSRIPKDLIPEDWIIVDDVKSPTQKKGDS